MRITFITHQRLEFEMQLVGVSCEVFSLCGLLRRLHGVVVWDYDTNFNANYFIISSEKTALCNCNRSAC